MITLVRSNIKLATASLTGAKWRSFLTMLGVAIGVVSVLTIVGIGEGVKRQVAENVHDLGSDLITIRPGKTVQRDAEGGLTGIGLTSFLGASTITDEDIEIVRQTPGVASVVPLSFVTATVEYDGQRDDRFLVVGTGDELTEVIRQDVAYGTFFGASDAHKHFAVIGKRVAEQLFKENVPIGKLFNIKGQEFVVRGVMEEFHTSPLQVGPDYNTAIFVPYEIAKELTGGTAQISQLIAQPADPATLDEAVTAVNENIQAAHDGQADFSVLKQEDTLAVTDTVLGLLTAMIAGIAAISLFVGGIGIMNIMLVSVTERTHEVGIRKAVGATNKQILGQFMTEAILLSLFGGALGIAVTYLVNGLLRMETDLQPVIASPAILAALIVSLVVGVVFGMAPALKAARKDPIQALRHE